MKRQTTYEEWPLSEEVGEAVLQLDHVRARYLLCINGKEFKGGHYEGGSSTWYPLEHSGEVRGILGELTAAVPEYPGSVGPEGLRRVPVGYGAAKYHVEDRALTLEDSVASGLTEDARVEVRRLFESFARQRFPDASKLYTLQRQAAEEPVLRRLGYRLVRENRRKPGGGRILRPMRTWAK